MSTAERELWVRSGKEGRIDSERRGGIDEATTRMKKKKRIKEKRKKKKKRVKQKKRKKRRSRRQEKKTNGRSR